MIRQRTGQKLDATKEQSGSRKKNRVVSSKMMKEENSSSTGTYKRSVIVVHIVSSK